MNKGYFLYGDVKLGFGNFELPPILIGTMFYQGQTLVDRKDACHFDVVKAKKRIDSQETLANQYKLPNLVEISAIAPEAMTKYLEFYLDNYDPPFVLGGSFDAKIAGIEYLTEHGIKPDDYIYNSISNLKNKREMEILFMAGLSREASHQEAMLNGCNNAMRKLLLAVKSAFEMRNFGEG